MKISSSVQLVLLNSIGLFVSFFLVLQHFGLAGSSPLCELGFSFSCSRVLSSEYAVLFGVPVAVHGLSYFSLALISSVLVQRLEQSEFRVRRDVHLASLVVSATGLASVFYFVVAEYLIGSVCPLCTVIHLVVVATFVISLRQYREGAYGVWSIGAVTDIAGNRIFWLIAAAFVVLLPIVIFNLPARHPSYLKADVDALASCMVKRNVKMYGANSCGHCLQQKGLFGESFSLIPYINCEVDEKVCETAKIVGYPTWVKEGDVAAGLKGIRSLKELASWAECPLN